MPAMYIRMSIWPKAWIARLTTLLISTCCVASQTHVSMRPLSIFDFARRGFQGSFVNIRYDDMRTFVGQPSPDGLADAVSTTHNNSYLVEKAVGLS